MESLNSTTVDIYCKLYHENCGILSDKSVSEIKNLIKIYPHEFGKILHAFFEPETTMYVSDSQYFALCSTAVETLLLSNNIFTQNEEYDLISFVGGKDKEFDVVLESVFGRAKLIIIECMMYALKNRYFVCKQLVDHIKKYYFNDSYYDNVLGIEKKENVPVLYYFVKRMSESIIN